VSDAITLQEWALTESVEVLGERHPDTSTARSSPARAYRSAGRLREAITLLRTAVVDAESLDFGHPHSA
jgi:hypothetical protein